MGLKIPPYTITQTTNADPGFYDLLGPFLSRREIVDELGTPVWDDDDKVWLVAHTDDDVFGFVSVQFAARHSVIRSLYVIPDARHMVIGGALVLRVMALWPVPLKAVATPAAVELFTSCGFVKTGERGRYTCFEWEGPDATVG